MPLYASNTSCLLFLFQFAFFLRLKTQAVIAIVAHFCDHIFGESVRFLFPLPQGIELEVKVCKKKTFSF